MQFSEYSQLDINILRWKIHIFAALIFYLLQVERYLFLKYGFYPDFRVMEGLQRKLSNDYSYFCRRLDLFAAVYTWQWHDDSNNHIDVVIVGINVTAQWSTRDGLLFHCYNQSADSFVSNSSLMHAGSWSAKYSSLPVCIIFASFNVTPSIWLFYAWNTVLNIHGRLSMCKLSVE